MKKFLLTVSCVYVVFISNAQQSFAPKDIKLLTGEWTGTLTYIDYKSGMPYTMPANMKITRLSKNKLVLSNIYPDEPKANKADTITFTKAGKMIDNEKVISKNKLPDGNTKIITEYTGKDGNANQPALIRHTYIFGKSLFSKRKDVKFIGEADWFKRHEYSYRRK